MIPLNTLVFGDCLDLFGQVETESIDLAMLDLPYGSTRCNFDTLIDLVPLWAELRRVLTPIGTVVAFGSQPFTTDQICAARGLFKYSLVWEKPHATGHFQANDRFLKSHEDILVFSKGAMTSGNHIKRPATFNPENIRRIGTKTVKPLKAGYLNRPTISNLGAEYDSYTGYSRSVLRFAKDAKTKAFKRHPHAKPVALLEYLIRTYSNEGDIVLDPTMGSGSAGVACVQSGRHFLGFERDPEFFQVAEQRIKTASERISEEVCAPPLLKLVVNG